MKSFIFALLCIFSGCVLAGDLGGNKIEITPPVSKSKNAIKEVPDQNGLYSGMPMLDYLALSLFKQDVVNDVAKHSLDYVGIKNPIDRYIAPKQISASKDVISASIFSLNTTILGKPLLQRSEDVRKYAKSVLAKASTPDVNIGAKLPFDDWYPNWISAQIATCQAGSRGRNGWPSGTEPVVGEIGFAMNLTQEKYEKGIFYAIPPGSPNYSLLKESDFSSDLTSKKAKSQIHMRNLVFDCFSVQQIMAGKIDLGIPGDGFKTITKSDPHYALTGYTEIQIPESSKNNYVKNLLSTFKASETDLAALKQVEDSINLWHFMALSEQNQPVKFAFKAPGRYWVIVTVTEKGIITRPVKNSDEGKLLPQLAPWQNRSQSDFTCIGFGSWSKPCFDYYLSNFGGKYFIGVVPTIKFVKEPVISEKDEVEKD